MPKLFSQSRRVLFSQHLYYSISRSCYQIYLTVFCVLWVLPHPATRLLGVKRTYFKHFICLECFVLAYGVVHNREERGV